jgi:DNA-binding MarR family transcriptional regulator
VADTDVQTISAGGWLSEAADSSEAPDPSAIAGELRLIVSQLLRRFRASATLPMPQITALVWLARSGSLTTSQLATLVSVRPQSMAHTVGELEAGGLVSRAPDPDDRRQTRIELTEAGEQAVAEFRRVGDRAIAETIVTELDAGEQRQLADALELLRRLA